MIKFASEMKKTMMWVAVALTMAACSSSDNDEAVDAQIVESHTPKSSGELKDITLTRGEQALVANNNEFAFNLFRVAGPREPSGPAGPCYEGPEASTILSPISITYALGMLNNGAAGETQQQINKVLGGASPDPSQGEGMGADAINDFCKKMLTQAPTLDSLTKVSIANTIYVNKGYELKAPFVQKANDYYGAQPETRDFHDGRTMDVINQWASDHTEKMIEKVLDESTFNPWAVSYLLNAIYFKGTWATKFDKDETQEEQFGEQLYGGALKVPMMHLRGTFQYAADDDCQVLTLPYGNGAYRMTVFLPTEGKTTYQLMQGLNAESWEKKWNNPEYGRPAFVDVKLPRFETKTDRELISDMYQLGMTNAFDANKAEFPNFCDRATYIGLMKQVARIKLNEEGTEAAAVTVIAIDCAGATPSEPKPLYFHANRPFLYVISEQSTGAIFFIGHYTGY